MEEIQSSEVNDIKKLLDGYNSYASTPGEGHQTQNKFASLDQVYENLPQNISEIKLIESGNDTTGLIKILPEKLGALYKVVLPSNIVGPTVQLTPFETITKLENAEAGIADKVKELNTTLREIKKIKVKIEENNNLKSLQK